MIDSQSRPHRRLHLLWWLVIPLALGIGLSFLIPRPFIGVIQLTDAIDGFVARDIQAQIDYVRIHPEIRAIVLVLDSPGGTVADTEAVYLELAALRKTIPVVTVVESMAASGAYYLAVGTDYIYAKPTSMVGNIGVIGYLPDSPVVIENIISTGPYKLWGTPRDTYARQTEMIKQGFFDAVQLGRGEALKVEPELLFSGQIWPGTEALRMGLIDALGSRNQAYQKAAKLAKIAHPEVFNLYQLVLTPEAVDPATDFYYTEGSRVAYPQNPGLYLLYIPINPEDAR